MEEGIGTRLTAVLNTGLMVDQAQYQVMCWDEPVSEAGVVARDQTGKWSPGHVPVRC